MSAFHNNMLVGASQPSGVTFDTTLIPNSVWLDGSADDLDRSTTSHSSTEMVMACWFQLNTATTGNIGLMGLGTGAVGSTNAGLWLSSNRMYMYNVGQGAVAARLLRDVGWYHVLGSWKLDESGINKGQLYINGTQVSDWHDDRRGSFGTAFGSTATQSVGSIFTNTFLKGYIAQPVMLDGQSIQGGDVNITDFLDTFTFGTNGSQIIPKANADIAALATTAGGNSFCLDFADSSDLGNDISSNNNDLTPNSMSSANHSGNTPSNSYPIFNHLQPTNSTLTFSEGNLRVTGSGGSDGGAIGTIPLPTSGTSEFQIKANNGDGRIGIIALDGAQSVDEPSNNCAGGVGLGFNAAYHYSENGQVRKVISSGSSNISGFDSWSTNDVITLRYNADANELNFLRNNSAVGSTVSTEAGLIYYPVICRFNNYDITAFFDSSKFPHTIGTGNLEVSSANQTAPEYQGIDYFDVTRYEGTGSSGPSRVGDFVPFTDVYTVDNSAIFEHDDKRYLSFTPDTGGNQKTFTISFWFKLTGQKDTSNVNSVISTDSGGKQFQIRFSDFNTGGLSGGEFDQVLSTNMYNGSSFVLNLGVDQKFGPSSTWTNAVFAYDTRTGVSSADKVKIYIDGVQAETSGTQLSTDDYDSTFNGNQEHQIGRQTNNAIGEPDIYFAEFVHVEGQQLGPDSFGQIDTSTNKWVPKDVSGLTFGSEGWYLEFDGTFGSGTSDSRDGTGIGAGKDSSGNNNHWREENDSGSAWATSDKSNDTPSNNLAVFDAADKIGSATPTLSEGALKFTGADNGGRYISGFPFTTGKFYWELDVVDAGSSFYPGFFTPAGIAFSSSTPWNSNSGSFVIAPVAGHWLGTNGDGTANITNNYTAFIGDGDRMFFAYDADNKFAYVGEVGSGGSGSTLTYYSLGGAVTADPTSGQSGIGAAPFGLHETGEQTFYFGILSGGTDVIANLIADPTKFNGTPPTGYVALTQDNMDATSDKLTNFAWIKNRDAADSHQLATVIEGADKSYTLDPDVGVAATSAPNKMSRFLQRGVQIGNDVTVNTVNESYVLWQWMSGSITPTDHSVGSIDGTDPQLSSKTLVPDHGAFSIMTYEGDETGGTAKTVAHGMGGIPEALWVRNVDTSGPNTPLQHKRFGSGKYILLNQATQAFTNSNYWADTDPTATLFTVGAGATPDTNDDGKTFQAVLFRSVPGVCKVGSYTGNNSATGPFIDCEFKPRWVMIKRDSASDAKWVISDTERTQFNSATPHILFPSESEDEDSAATAPDVEFFHSGFRLTNTSNKTNSSGTYIYIAIAEIGGGGTLPPIYAR